MNALGRWREGLEARAIPDGILAAAPESPFGFPAELFRSRAEQSAEREAAPTTLRALEALPEGGTVLDVGVGGGATSLPLAGRASRLVGVDGLKDMLESFAAAARAAGVLPSTVLGRWPDVVSSVEPADVVVCGHVVYNVPDLEPFARALDERALRRVVVELTERHPLAWMADLWSRFHGVRFPQGPTAADAAQALEELGFDVRHEERTVEGDRGGGFARPEDAVALVRRRLCLPAERDPALADALGERLRRSEDGLWSAGPPAGTVVTLWWDRASPRS